MANVKPKPQLEPACFVAMLPNYWGKANTLYEAVRNCKKAAGKAASYPLHHFLIRAYVLPQGATEADVYVTGMGDTMYPQGAQSIVIQLPAKGPLQEVK